RRHGNADRTGMGCNPAHRSARGPARHWRPASRGLWRSPHLGRAVHAGRHRAGGAIGACGAKKNMSAGHASDQAAGARSGALLHTETLSNRFGGVHAVRNISLTVPERAIFAIIGPNGAGKSTLLNLLSGIYPADSGKTVFADVDLTHFPAHQRARYGIARTFQKIRLFQHLSVLDNVLAGFH